MAKNILDFNICSPLSARMKTSNSSEAFRESMQFQRLVIFLIWLSSSVILPGFSTNGLVASYLLNGNANDSSANGFHGVVTGATLTRDRFDNASSAYLFSNELEYISLPIDLLTNTQGTIAFWIKTEALLTGITGSGSYIPFSAPELNFDKGIQLGLGDFTQLLDDEMLGATISANPGNGRSGVPRFTISPIQPGWHHVAFVTGPAGHAYYLDGQKYIPSIFSGGVTAAANLLPVNAVQIRLGGLLSSDSTIRPFALDEVLVYKRVLTDAEVRSIAEPPVLSIRVSQVELCWNSQTNLQYQLQHRSTLTTNNWLDLGGVITATNTQTCVLDFVAPGQPQRYYRILQVE